MPTIDRNLAHPATKLLAGVQSSCPAAHPQPIVDKLNATIAMVVTLPEVKKLFEEQGTEGASSTQAEMAKLLREEYLAAWRCGKGLGLKVRLRRSLDTRIAASPQR